VNSVPKVNDAGAKKVKIIIFLLLH